MRKVFSRGPKCNRNLISSKLILFSCWGLFNANGCFEQNIVTQAIILLHRFSSIPHYLNLVIFVTFFSIFFLGFYWQFIPDIFFNRLLSILLKHLVIVKYRAIKYCRCQDKEVKYSQVYNGQQFCQKVGNKIIGSN